MPLTYLYDFVWGRDQVHAPRHSSVTRCVNLVKSQLPEGSRLSPTLDDEVLYLFLQKQK